MNKTMTPSQEMTDEQTDKAVDLFRSALRKHQSEFKRDAVQQALGAKGLAKDMLAVFRTHVERFGNLLIRIVSVDRTRTPKQALTATGREQYTDSGVVAAMPKGTATEVKVVFFKPDKSAYDKKGLISDDDLGKEYASRGLKPTDPFSLAAVNEADPAFSDEHPNATHWKDANGKWCYAAFHRWNDDERNVSVDRRGDVWDDVWLFAGEQVSA